MLSDKPMKSMLRDMNRKEIILKEYIRPQAGCYRPVLENLMLTASPGISDEEIDEDDIGAKEHHFFGDTPSGVGDPWSPAGVWED